MEKLKITCLVLCFFWSIAKAQTVSHPEIQAVAIEKGCNSYQSLHSGDDFDIRFNFIDTPNHTISQIKIDVSLTNSGGVTQLVANRTISGLGAGPEHNNLLIENLQIPINLSVGNFNEIKVMLSSDNSIFNTATSGTVYDVTGSASCLNCSSLNASNLTVGTGTSISMSVRHVLTRGWIRNTGSDKILYKAYITDPGSSDKFIGQVAFSESQHNGCFPSSKTKVFTLNGSIPSDYTGECGDRIVKIYWDKDNNVVDNPEITASIGSFNVYFDGGTICTSGPIQNEFAGNITVACSSPYVVTGGPIMHRAHNFVKLQVGFHSTNGSLYHAQISPCSASRSDDSDESIYNDNNELSYSDDIDIYEDNTETISSKLADEQITAFPNPVKNSLHIKGLIKAEARISIFDLSGVRVLSSSSMSFGTLDVDLTGMKSGMYLLEIDQEGQSQIIKLVKD